MNCEIEIPCSSNPCLNSGLCSNSEDFSSYSCECGANHSGLNCEIEIPCSTNPCVNNGVCENSEDLLNYSCNCLDGFSGLNCEITTTTTTTTTTPTTTTTTTTSTTTTTTPEPTTISEPSTSSSQSCNLEFSQTLIQSDHSIRLLDSSRKQNCAFKKYSSYKNGDEIWYKPCDVQNSNPNKAGKYQFSFDPTTGQIKSKGALDSMNKNFCWQVPSLTRNGKQRMKLQGCDSESDKQKFTVISGRLHVQVNTGVLQKDRMVYSIVYPMYFICYTVYMRSNFYHNFFNSLKLSIKCRVCLHKCNKERFKLFVSYFRF